MDRLLRQAADRAADYLDHLGARPVFPSPEALEKLTELGGSLPEAPTDPELVLDILDAVGSPATVAGAGGRYFGFVVGGTLPVALAANWLAAAWDQNAMSSVSSPVAAKVEEIVIPWLLDLLNLPEGCAGALVTGAMMANFTALAAARHAVLRTHGWDVEADGLCGSPPVTVVISEQAHPTLLKAAKARRRWFQFRLRTLLVLMLLVCIGMSWFAMKMQQARRQRAAVNAIVQSGGEVNEWSPIFVPLSKGSRASSRNQSVSSFTSSTRPSYVEESQAHAWLRKLLGNDYFAHPVAASVKDDVGMNDLDGLPTLEMLEVSGRQITDAGLEHAKGLPLLHSLHLFFTSVTDAGVEHLRGLTRLQTLWLVRAQITDGS